MKPIFEKIKINRPQTNVFDLSHERKFSFDMGELTPFYLQECVPGDKFRINNETFLRVAPLISPVMHRLNVYTHYFFVPYRLLWSAFEDFITGGADGDLEPAFPYVRVNTANANDFWNGTLPDYLGIPTNNEFTVPAGVTWSLNALPFRAYQLIWHEYFRDQNQQQEYTPLKTSGMIGSTEWEEIKQLRKRCWEKDYFTSALPWAQRGGQVLLPSDIQYQTQAQLRNGTGLPATGGLATDADGSINDTLGNALGVENIESLGITVNDLRRSVKLQEWLEKNARSGARYIEQIFAHFGVKSKDSRLQRPEFLGGSKSPITISEVLSTVEGDTYPQGNMAGHGISASRNYIAKKYCEEHGFLIGIMSVLPRTSYQQGLPRLFSKFDKFDYYFPEFANLGEQEVLNQELYWDTEDEVDNNHAAFGYQSRYAEYKFNNSSVHGDFRGNLNFWHMGRIFEKDPNVPTLSEEFVVADPTKRVFAVDDPEVDSLYCQVYNDIQAVRPMPIFGTPSF